jgi:hypothetical protein
MSLSLCVMMLIHFTASGCDDDGIHVWFNGDRGRFAVAYVDAGDWSADSYIEFTGSFIAPESTDYIFDVWADGYCSWYGHCSGDPEPMFWIDEEVMTGGEEIASTGRKRRHTVPMVAGYRYRIRMRTSDDHTYIKASIAAKWLDREMEDLRGPFLKDCYESGCANTAHLRTYGCGPSPSVSKSPSPSQSMSRTISKSPSPTPSTSLQFIPSSKLVRNFSVASPCFGTTSAFSGSHERI